MKKAFACRSVGLLLAGISLSSCGQISHLATKDGTVPAGLLGAETNSFLPAYTENAEIFRVAEIAAVLADTGQHNALTTTDREALIKTLVITSRHITYVFNMIGRRCNDPTTAASSPNLTAGCQENVEAYDAMLEEDIVQLAKYSLPTEKFQKFLSDIGSGNWLGSVEVLLSATGQIIIDFHHAAAANRSARYIIVNSVAPSHDGAYKTFRDAEAAIDTELKSQANHPDPTGPLYKYSPGWPAIDAMNNLTWTYCNRMLDDLSTATALSTSDKFTFNGQTYPFVAQSPPAADGSTTITCNIASAKPAS